MHCSADQLLVVFAQSMFPFLSDGVDIDISELFYLVATLDTPSAFKCVLLLALSALLICTVSQKALTLLKAGLVSKDTLGLMSPLYLAF